MPSAERQRNPRGQGALLRERLIDAAVEVISDVGDLSKVSVRAITARAGVSPTALYLHFADREEIVDAAIDSGFESFNGAIAAEAAGEEDPRERILAMGRAYLRFAEEQPALYAVIFTARREMTGEHPHAEARKAGLAALTQTVAETGAGEPDEVASALWAALHGFVTLRELGMTRTFPSPERYLRRINDAYLP